MPDRWLPEFYDIHKGQHAVLFGKGPSLDEWDLPKRDGEIWMAINEACRSQPESDYHIMSDRKVLNNLKKSGWVPGSALVVSIGNAGGPKQPRRRWPGHTIFYHKGDDRIHSTGPTSGDAIQVLAAMGIRDILMVGFDGYSKFPDHKAYAHSIGKLPYVEPQHPNEVIEEYRWIHGYIDRMIAKTSVTITLWHKNMKVIRHDRAFA